MPQLTCVPPLAGLSLGFRADGNTQVDILVVILQFRKFIKHLEAQYVNTSAFIVVRIVANELAF